MNKLILIAVLVLLPVVIQAQSEEDSSFSKIKMKTLTGEEIQLSKFDGKVVVFVNVASKCGYTKQYSGLQKLHENYSGKDVFVVGVPCNQFGGQEPGTAEEIATFCKKNYGVEFAMMEKVDVKGDKQCELYKYLTGFDLKPAGKGPVKWNFEKFVVGRDGKPIARFRSNVKPDDKKFLAAIDKAVGEKTSASSGTGSP